MTFSHLFIHLAGSVSLFPQLNRRQEVNGATGFCEANSSRFDYATSQRDHVLLRALAQHKNMTTRARNNTNRARFRNFFSFASLGCLFFCCRLLEWNCASTVARYVFIVSVRFVKLLISWRQYTHRNFHRQGIEL